MPVKHAKINKSAEAMAEQVLADICDRGLVTGDRYFTAEQARSNFRVGKGLINDALKLLADREILVRKRKAGTFIGPQFMNGSTPPIRAGLDAVHVLMPMDYYRAKVVTSNAFVDALTQAIPEAMVHVHHIPDHETTAFSRDLISQIKQQRTDVVANREGLVLLRSAREVQQAAQDSGIPTVVFGSTYPDIKNLPSIDSDQEQAGQLAARAALRRGHKRLALVMRSQWRRGDNLLMEGFSRELGEAGIAADGFNVFSFCEDPEVIGHDVAALLGRDDPPTVLVCRSRFHAQAAIRGIQEIGLTPGQEIDVISIQPGPEPCDGVGVMIRPTIGAAEQVAQVGDLLSQAAKNQPPEQMRRVIPMQIIDPLELKRRPA